MAVDNGGVIGKINTPTTSLASGVWSLGDQFESQSSDIWPLAFPLKGVGNSCFFQDSDNDDLSRSIASTGNNKTYTVSAWVKRVELGQSSPIFGTGDGGTNNDARMCFFDASDKIEISYYNSGYTYEVTTTRVFRDLSAWYHLCILFDTTQSTASDRVKIYVNGVQETVFDTSSYPSENATFNFGNTSYNHYVNNMGGRNIRGSHYIAELVYLDGSTADVSNFGATDPVSGIWCPKAISTTALTFGTNGVYLDFADSSALGDDESGNGNDYTVNNITSVQQSTDNPVNNYSTMNALLIGSGVTMAEGNLSVAMNASAQFGAFSSIGVSTGKWYMEMKYTVQVAGADRMMVGISGNPANLRQGAPIGSSAGYVGGDSESFGYYSDGGNSYNNEAATSYGDSWTVNDIIGIALDLDNNKLYFSKNGTWQDSGDPTSGSTGTGAISITAPSSVTTGNYFFAVSDTSGVYGGTIVNNFGNPVFSISSGNSDGNGYGNFEYAVPSGYYALNTKNLAEFG
jgi:hypothetical protein